MKCSIGLLGLGSRTTSFYLDCLNYYYQQKNNLDSTCPLLLINTDFSTINPHLPDNFEQLEPIISTYVEQFKSVKRLIIPNITLHETIDRLIDKSQPICKVVHPVTELLNRLKRDNIREVILVGSKYTMTSPYLRNQLISCNIKVSTPNPEDRLRIDELRTKVYSRAETIAEVDTYRQLLSAYAKVTTVVIACTELSLILPMAESNFYDMAQIQVEQSFV